MKLNRRFFFGRLAAACGLPFLTRAEPLPVTRGAADFVLPLKRHETAFGVVEMLPHRCTAEIQAALLRMREDMDKTLLSDAENPLEQDAATLTRLKEREMADTTRWIVSSMIH